mmetsp:Transcript_26389/g.38996  ORF Transcript_26389/g.38996 Transcript_26389/m.38996 type:complete len:261 (+) Transcript_26389:1071-1853(+)
MVCTKISSIVHLALIILHTRMVILLVTMELMMTTLSTNVGSFILMIPSHVRLTVSLLDKLKEQLHRLSTEVCNGERSSVATTPTRAMKDRLQIRAGLECCQTFLFHFRLLCSLPRSLPLRSLVVLATVNERQGAAVAFWTKTSHRGADPAVKRKLKTVTVSSDLQKVERVDPERAADRRVHLEDPKVRVELVIRMSHHQLSLSQDEARAAAEDVRMSFKNFLFVNFISARQINSSFIFCKLYQITRVVKGVKIIIIILLT